MRNRAEIKAEAKGILRGARVSPYLVTLLVIAIGFALDRVVDMARGGSPLYSYEFTRQYIMRPSPAEVRRLWNG